MSLACESDCADMTWDYAIDQLQYSGILWGGLAVVGQGVALLVRCRGYAWEEQAMRLSNKMDASMFMLVLDFICSAIMCLHFAVRTNFMSLSLVGYMLEVVPAVVFLLRMLPRWALMHVRGMGSGFGYMCISALLDSILIGSVAALPFSEYNGRKTWFAPSWLSCLHIISGWRKVLEAFKVNLSIPRNEVMSLSCLTLFNVYFMAMCILTFENLGDPEILKPLSKDKWNAVSSIYFVLTSVCTVGFGDLAPTTSLSYVFTVVIVYGGLIWLAINISKSNSIISKNRDGGGFFEPIEDSQYIVVIGNASADTLKNFLSEIFHTDHADDAENLVVSILIHQGSPTRDQMVSWLGLPGNVRMMTRVKLFTGSPLEEKDLNRLGVGSCSTLFVLPDFLSSNVMKEDTENIIRMMAVQRLVSDLRIVLLLLRASNQSLLSKAQLNGNLSCMAYDQFKLEVAGKSCQVHGFAPLLTNLCKCIAIDDSDDEEDDEGSETGSKTGGKGSKDDGATNWRQDFERGAGIEMYEVELSSVYTWRECTFIEAVTDVLDKTNGLVYLIGLVEIRGNHKNVLLNPGPLYKIRQRDAELHGIFLAADRDAILQSEDESDFKGTKDRGDESAGKGTDEDVSQQAASRPVAKPKLEFVPELAHVQLNPDQKETAGHLARCVRANYRALVPQRPPIRTLAAGGHIILLCVGCEDTEDLRLGVEHFVKPLRQNVAIEDMVPVVVMSTVVPKDWAGVDSVDFVYWLQGSPIDVLDLNRINFLGASAIFITHCGAGRDESADSVNDSWAVDFEVICCTRLVESQLEKSGSVIVIADIVVDVNHPFLPLPGQIGATAASNVQAKSAWAALGYRPRRASFGGSLTEDLLAPTSSTKRTLGSLLSNLVGANEKVKTEVDRGGYYLQPRFAAGRLFAGSNAFVGLAANTFYNPSLMQMVSRMITTEISMLRLPHAWEGKPYAELLDYLLWQQKFLAIGIYRQAEMSLGGSDQTQSKSAITASAPRLVQELHDTRKSVKLGFVYTAPPARTTKMKPGDQIICLHCPEDSG
eukprot:TRINITY_DN58591_c0_g1_i1.p1 TRINITY_DN58591_c0_g1~~TRINITY_DN58591_c0_g1_i1.p1  ORF type:complete len:1044 (+),score=166.57 TRINITY_DN58591_c0_g1_i1:142-3273(+)